VTDIESIKAGLAGIVPSLDGLDMTTVQEGWAQAAATFASLMQGSAKPGVGEAQQLLGRTANDLFEILGRSTELDGMINELIASL